MDINQKNFWTQLPSIIAIIAYSQYVAIDVITTDAKAIRAGQEAIEGSVWDRGVPDLELLDDPPIFQLGLTAICWAGGKYKMFTFTVPVTPLFERISPRTSHVVFPYSRDVRFPDASVRRGIRQGFDAATALEFGVPYLNRVELESGMAWAREERHFASWKPRLTGSPEAWENAFVEKIRLWLDNSPTKSQTLIIPEPRGGTLRPTTLSAVRRIMRERFPKCRLIRRGDDTSIEILLSGRRREKSFIERVQRRKSVARALGASIVLAALFPSDTLKGYYDSGLLPIDRPVHSHIIKSLGQDAEGWPEQPFRQWEKLVQTLQMRRPAILGHRIGASFATMYSRVIEPLPFRSRQRIKALNDAVPRCIDLSLIDPRDDVISQKPLAAIYRELESLKEPFVGHIMGWSYNGSNPTKSLVQDAGFNSYMVAMVFLKLSIRRYDKWRWLYERFPRGKVPLPPFDSHFFQPVRRIFGEEVEGATHYREGTTRDDDPEAAD